MNISKRFLKFVMLVFILPSLALILSACSWQTTPHEGKQNELIQEIAVKYNITEEAIRKENPTIQISNDGKLLSDQVINVPAPELPPGYTVHIVKPNETIHTIAQLPQYKGTCVNGILTVNKLKNDSFIKVGWQLAVPLPQPPAPAYKTHTVQRGETVRAIAIKHPRSSEQGIRDRNQIPNNSAIVAGQQLSIEIPAPPGTPILPAEGCDISQPQQGGTGVFTPKDESTPPPEANYYNEVYVVQRGDTLYDIARRYGTTVKILCQDNNVRNQNIIHVGQKLNIRRRI